MLLFAALGLQAADTALLTPDEWLHDWEVQRDFTIAVAEKMPAELYSYRPAEPQLGFAAQMAHIAGSLIFRFEQISGLKSGIVPPKTGEKSNILKFLRESFDFVIATVPRIKPDQLTRMYKVDWPGRPEANGRQIMLNMFVHTAHHRAQCEVYMRLKGIEPPVYTF